MIGAIWGLKTTGIVGGVLGLLLGLSIGIMIVQFLEGAFDSWKAGDTFNTVMTAILGGVIGAAFGGFGGAIIGLLLGASVSIISMNYLNGLDNSGKEKAVWALCLYSLMGTVIGAQFGGVAGGIIGLILGLAVAFASMRTLYRLGRVDLNGLRQAVADGVITAEEFTAITGVAYA